VNDADDQHDAFVRAVHEAVSPAEKVLAGE
jgi:hypothetical protein